MYPLIYLRWLDAQSPQPHWMSEAEFIESCNIVTVNTVGYVVFEDEHQLKLVQSYFEPTSDEPRPQMSCGIAIPKSWILERKDISHID